MTTSQRHRSPHRPRIQLAASQKSAIHLIDIENLAGGAYPSPHIAVGILDDYAVCGGHQDGDLTFLAANRHLLHSIVFDLPFACRPSAAAPGADGAELALLDVAPIEWVCRRFGRVVIGSGDHKFADLAAAALAAGLDVIVVGQPGTIARVYFDLGCEIRFLGAPEVTALTTAGRADLRGAVDDVA